MRNISAKERVRAAIGAAGPDRVPIAVSADWAYVAKAAGMSIEEFIFGDNRVRAHATIRMFRRHAGIDILLCPVGVSEAFARSHRLRREGDRVLVTDENTGETLPIAERYEMERSKSASSANVADRPISTRADIEEALGPLPTTEEVLARGIHDPESIIARELGDEAFLVRRAGHPTERLVYHLGGFNRTMEMIATNSDLVAEVFVRIAAQKAIENISTASDNGVDGVRITASMEGADMISPHHWRQIMLPGYRIMVERARAAGLSVLMWFLGDCMPLLRDLVELGIDGLWIEQPRRGSAADLREIRRTVGDAFCITGWTNDLEMIHDDRPAIARRVRDQIRHAGARGALIMSTSHLADDVSCETVDFWCRQALQCSF
ncbi:MAG: uroporphyrinogen decarboxylase family protein [Planctomycetota bacterium]